MKKRLTLICTAALCAVSTKALSGPPAVNVPEAGAAGSVAALAAGAAVGAIAWERRRNRKN